MSMVVNFKNQIHVTIKSVQYALMREMLNKTSFWMNVLFMILNNATFIIEWILLYALKDDVGGYSFQQILLLWAIAASTYGFSHFFFKRSYTLYDTITNGKLDSYLVQPKNVLLSAITSDVDVSAIGDMLYGYIVLLISGCTIAKFFLFTLFTICGGIMTTAVAVIFSSVSFWFGRADMIADTGNSLLNNFSTYPDGIFKGTTKVLLFTLIPVGITNYIPIWVMTKFSLPLTLLVILVTIFSVSLAFFMFYKGLKRYSSSNLMIARI